MEERESWLAVDIHPRGFFTSAAIIIGSVAATIVFHAQIGDIRLGGSDAKPEFTRLGWFAMLFSAGVVGGVFDPVELEGVPLPEGVTINSSLSYAVSIEYGTALLEKTFGSQSE